MVPVTSPSDPGEWAARPALISAYLQELCARSKDSRQIFALGCNVASPAYRCNVFQAEAYPHSMIRGASNVHTCRYLLSGF